MRYSLRTLVVRMLFGRFFELPAKQLFFYGGILVVVGMAMVSAAVLSKLNSSENGPIVQFSVPIIAGVFCLAVGLWKRCTDEPPRAGGWDGGIQENPKARDDDARRQREEWESGITDKIILLLLSLAIVGSGLTIMFLM